ncbi:MAG: YqgE/AlgH family protein [Pseudomonadota bacterium]
MTSTEEAGTFLTGQCLIAMPTMGDPRFERSVVYLCSHSSEGALGIIVNKPVEEPTFSDLCEQLGIPLKIDGALYPIYFGGPVEQGRGFVLHTADFEAGEDGMLIDEQIGLSATLDSLRAIADGRGPERGLVSIGYAGWAPGQLEQEIAANGWLHCEADVDLVFGQHDVGKWEAALSRLGVRPELLSGEAGHA